MSTNTEKYCDIVVMGAGISGLCAAIQARELGMRVVVLEANSAVSQNTEGIFAVDSHFQQEQGIQIDRGALLDYVAKYYNYRVDLLFWKDMIDHSAENLHWLEERGVQFSGKVDPFFSHGRFPTFHWFREGSGKYLTLPLVQEAERQGVEILYGVRGKKLAVDSGSVKGIIAETGCGDQLSVFATAVILASGGFPNNAELMASSGMSCTMGDGSRRGDGLRMALEAGAKSTLNEVSSICACSFMEQGWMKPLPDWACHKGNVIWVNESGKRFVNECCSDENSMAVCHPVHHQKRAFVVFGDSNLQCAPADVQADARQIAGADTAYFIKTDSISALAEWMDVPAQDLKETITHYNEMCREGLDDSFGKKNSCLTEILPPYYAGTLTEKYFQSIGGIAVDRSAEVISEAGSPIPGLYAVGTDACMLYNQTYTIHIPASCNGHNIHSGRVAAKAAAAWIRASHADLRCPDTIHKDCDIVVVGAGISGLTAAVQAAELGAKVIVLETSSNVSKLTEGLFAIGTRYQKEQGIRVTKGELVDYIMRFNNYRSESAFWEDMIDHSGENLHWLEKYGARFSGQVDYYYDHGEFPTFHWFVDGLGSNLTVPMEASAKELGVEFLFRTRGRELLLDGNRVTGVLAETVSGETVAIHSRSVILATGSFRNSKEIFAVLDPETPPVPGTRKGDGILMAIAAGAENRTDRACYVREPNFINRFFLRPLPSWANYSGLTIWVNENGERFVNELCGSENSICIDNALQRQKMSYALFGAPAFATAPEEAQRDAFDELQGDNPAFCKADTIEELALWAKMDPEKLRETVEHYNLICEKQHDDEFGKPSGALVKLSPPYYMGTIRPQHGQPVGGLTVNLDAAVLRADGSVISGLYAAGTDSCMLYKETYTISIPASCNGHNVHSGRVAAKSAWRDQQSEQRGN